MVLQFAIVAMVVTLFHIYICKTIRPLSLPVPIPAQRARKPSQMQQKTNSSHLPPPAGPTGVHPDAVPLILFSLAYASRVQTSFLCCCNPTVFAEFCSHPVRSILFLGYLITSDHFDVNFIYLPLKIKWYFYLWFGLRFSFLCTIGVHILYT